MADISFLHVPLLNIKKRTLAHYRQNRPIAQSVTLFKGGSQTQERPFSDDLPVYFIKALTTMISRPAVLTIR